MATDTTTTSHSGSKAQTSKQAYSITFHSGGVTTVDSQSAEVETVIRGVLDLEQTHELKALLLDTVSNILGADRA